jgi:hypothetical protein
MRCVVRIALFLLSLGVALQCQATQMRPLSIEQLTRKAHLVLHGTVLSKTCVPDAQAVIMTQIELQVSEAWKGAPKASPFVVVQSGGILGDRAVSVSGQEEFSVGEEVVLFLVLNAREEGVVVGISQGKFQVSKDPASGEACAHNRFHGTRASQGSGSARGRSRLPLVELKRQVQQTGP